MRVFIACEESQTDLLMDMVIRYKSAPEFSRESGINKNVILQGKVRQSLVSGRYLIINDDLHAAGLCVYENEVKP